MPQRSRSSRGRRKQHASAPLVGSETPRIWTRPLRELTPETTLGFSVIEFADKILKIELLPWQRWLLIHALELHPEGGFRFRYIVLLVARQNGKSLLSQVLALWFMYVYGFRLVLGTAQDLDTAEEVWSGAVDLIEELDEDENPVRPELLALRERVVMVNGKKSLELTTGSRYKVKAATRRAGRGLSGDLVMLDELREHQSWDAWGAITKTTMARDEAMIWCLSNAGDPSSIVLAYLRKMAHAALGDPDGINANDDPSRLIDEDLADELDVDLEVDPDDDSLGIFEWSAPPGCDLDDPDGWCAANPSLGYLITERTIRANLRTDPEWTFRTEVLCQWIDSTLDGPFPPGTWEAGHDPTSCIAAEIPDTRRGFCLDVSWDRSMTYIAVGGPRADEDSHVEVIAARSGTDWVVPWFTDDSHPRRKDYRVAIQPSGPAGSLIEPLREAGVDVVEWKGADLGASCGSIYDKVREGHLKHRGQPALNVAAAVAATRPVGDGSAWAWDRKKSPVDIASLVAVTGADWLASQPVEDDLDPWFSFGS